MTNPHFYQNLKYGDDENFCHVFHLVVLTKYVNNTLNSSKDLNTRFLHSFVFINSIFNFLVFIYIDCSVRTHTLLNGISSGLHACLTILFSECTITGILIWDIFNFSFGSGNFSRWIIRRCSPLGNHY